MTAKGLTNGVIPMGAVFATSDIYEAFMRGPENLIEFFHGYTYSGHPIAAAAALATLDTYAEEGLLTRAAEIGPYFEDALHSLAGEPNVIDIRNIGLVGAIELAPIEGHPTKRAFQAFLDAFEKGLLIRTTGDIIALSPPLIIEKGQVGRDRRHAARRAAGAGLRAMASLGNAKHLRVEMADAERKLWASLRGRRLGDAKVRRQVPIGPYIADFLCFERRLVIEVDGSQHFESETDAVRDAWFTENGYRTMRFTNYDVSRESRCRARDDLVCARSRHRRTSPPSPLAGEGARQGG